jgi:hypothetical protein
MASESRAWAGWVIFAGSVALIIGMLNTFEGIVALIWDERVVATPENFVIVDLTGFGWVLLLSGLLMLAVAVGLFSAQPWARIAAIVIVCLHAAMQIAWIGAYPLWALLMIGLDIVVLYALTARWTEARAVLDEDYVEERPSVPSARTSDETAARTTRV